MRTTFESHFMHDDGHVYPRTYVGMFRPAFEDALRMANGNPAGYRFGASIYTDRCREAWLAGEFDRPLYSLKSEEAAE